MGFRSFRGHEKSVWNVAFSPDGRHVVSGSGDGTLKMWEVSSGECLRSFRRCEGGVVNVAFSRNGKNIVVGDRCGLSVWSVRGNCDVNVSLRIRLFRGGVPMRRGRRATRQAFAGPAIAGAGWVGHFEIRRPDLLTATHRDL